MSDAGRVCRRCSTWKPAECFGAERRVLCGLKAECYSCRNSEQKANYSSLSLEQRVQRQKVIYDKHRDRIRRTQKKWRDANRDEYLAWRRARYRRDPNGYVVSWQAKNRARVRSYKRKWKRANPLRVAWHTAQRNHRLRGSVTWAEWRGVLRFYGNKCLQCGSVERVEMDHVVPIAKGGRHVVENLQPLCRSCNGAKGIKSLDFRAGRIYSGPIQGQLFEAG